MVRFRAFLCALVVASGAGCSNTTPRTEVLVVVDTDLRGAGGIDNLFIEVTSPGGERQTSTAQIGSDQPPLPRSIALVWETGPLGPFTVRAVGNTGGTQRVERTARFDFQRDRTLVLPLFLLGRCEGMACGASQTCGESGCRSIEVAPSELVAYEGTLPGLDAGAPARDGGVDGGPRDAGTFDGGRDGGSDAGTDAGPPIDVGTDAFVPTDSCPGVVEVCNTMDDNCDGTTDEGFDLDTDPMNCGACGHACDFANATGSCSGGVCVITACDTGFDDCNTMGDDGCEIDIANDRMHCGSCTMVCTPPDRECCASTCQRTCP